MSKNSSDPQPEHVGLILDGNRRWARAQGLPTLEGHRTGYANLKTIVKHAILNRGVPYISAYIFSTENWRRAAEEVKYLMDLALWIATHEVDEMHKNNIRIRYLGSPDKLSPKLIKAIERAESKTAGNTAGTVGLCFNYGGQQEIVEAVRAAAQAGEDIVGFTEAQLAAHLYAPEMPPLDLIIQTSGEQRISNFMLWRAAYAEMLFVEPHWPAFTTVDFDTALAEYARRQRRFGS